MLLASIQDDHFESVVENELRKHSFDEVASYEHAAAPLYQIKPHGVPPLTTYSVTRTDSSLSRLVVKSRSRLHELVKFIGTGEAKWLSVPYALDATGKASMMIGVPPEKPLVSSETPMDWVSPGNRSLEATLGDGGYWLLGLTLGREYRPFSWQTGLRFNMPSEYPSMLTYLSKRWAISAPELEALWEQEILNPTWATYDIQALLRLREVSPRRAQRAVIERVNRDAEAWTSRDHFYFQRVTELSSLHPLELVGKPLPPSLSRLGAYYLRKWLSRGTMKLEQEWLSLVIIPSLCEAEPHLCMSFAKWRAVWSPKNKEPFRSIVSLLSRKSKSRLSNGLGG